MSKKYVSELINGQHKEWVKGNIIFIDSGTGTGKSHFIRNELTQLAEERWANILFIFNRSELYDQNNETLHKENNFRITIATYQEIEHDIMNKDTYDFSKYKYIVCDECHYFTEDSQFNDNCDVSLNAIMELLDNHITILMSATGDTIYKYLISKGKQPNLYSQPRDFSHISSLSFYNKDNFELVERFIEDKFPAPTDKILWFCESVEQAAEFHIKYPDSSFKCSESKANKKYHQYLSKDTIIYKDGKITFTGKFLFTTKVLDNGFDLIDENIKLIVCGYFDLNTVIQCIGRKRAINEHDKVNVVLLNYGNQSIAGFKTSKQQIKDEADVIISGGVEEWIKKVGKFGRKVKHIIMDTVSDKDKMDSKKKVSLPKYLRVVADLETMNHILHENRELNKFREASGEKKENDGYMQFMMTQLNKTRCYPLEDYYKKRGLDDYLESIIGKMLWDSEREELIDKMNIRADGKQIKSRSSLNSVIAEMELNFVIESRVETKGEHRKKTYWIVCKITY